MAQFTVNAQRFDPYKNFKFRVKWDGRYVAGVSKVSALKRTTEVVEHREGGDPSTSPQVARPHQVRADHARARRHPRHRVRAVGEQGLELRLRARRGGLAQGLPQGRDHRDLQRGRASSRSPTRSTAAGSPSSRRCPTSTPTPTPSRSSRSSSRTRAGSATTTSPSRPSRSSPSPREPTRPMRPALEPGDLRRALGARARRCTRSTARCSCSLGVPEPDTELARLPLGERDALLLGLARRRSATASRRVTRARRAASGVEFELSCARARASGAEPPPDRWTVEHGGVARHAAAARQRSTPPRRSPRDVDAAARSLLARASSPPSATASRRGGDCRRTSRRRSPRRLPQATRAPSCCSTSPARPAATRWSRSSTSRASSGPS